MPTCWSPSSTSLFAEDLVDLGHLAPHVAGVDELRAAVAPFTPDAVATTVGVDAEVIRRLAREIAAAPTAAVYGRIGTCTVEFGTLASWAVDVINVLTGNLDRPGGAMFPLGAHERGGGSGTGRGFVTGRHRSRVKGYPEAIGELPVATLADEIETPGEGQIRALVTIAGNPVVSTPNAGRLDAALGSLDFMVCVDIYVNETTRHANVILPAPSPLERSEYALAFYGMAVHNFAAWSPPLFEPDGPDGAPGAGPARARPRWPGRGRRPVGDRRHDDRRDPAARRLGARLTGRRPHRRGAHRRARRSQRGRPRASTPASAPAPTATGSAPSPTGCRWASSRPTRTASTSGRSSPGCPVC